MTVDREALRRRFMDAAEEGNDGCVLTAWAIRELGGLGLSLLAELEKLEAEQDLIRQELPAIHKHLEGIDRNSVTLWEQRDEARAERDRLKDALSHAYADARALWAAERDQLEAELASVTSISGALQDEVARLRGALAAIINSAPNAEPERYDGESHELVRDNAMDTEAYWLAQVARRALESEGA